MADWKLRVSLKFSRPGKELLKMRLVESGNDPRSLAKART